MGEGDQEKQLDMPIMFGDTLYKQLVVYAWSHIKQVKVNNVLAVVFAHTMSTQCVLRHPGRNRQPDRAA